MKRFSIFLIVFFLIGKSYAQEDSDYFADIAGDSALNSGKNIYTRDIGDTIKLTLAKGPNRFVFSKGIKINDGISLQLLNSNWQLIEFKIHEAYLDFHIDSREDVYLVMTTE